MTSEASGPEPAPPGAGALARARLLRGAAAATLLTLLMVLSSAVRLDALSQKICIESDECVSYMAAAAKEASWFDQQPSGHWVPAGEWTAFFRIDEPFAFRRIQQELVRNDMHPPLYFWLLHLTALWQGIEPATGGRLNLLLHLVAMGLVFRLGLLASGSSVVGLTAVGLFSFSPAVISTSVLARQYELLALTTIASLLALRRLMEARARRGPAALLLGLALFCMLLTHYQSLLLLPILAVIAWLHRAWLSRDPELRPSARRSLVCFALTLLVTGALYLALQPAVVSELGVHMSRNRITPATLFNARWARVADAVAGFLPTQPAAGHAPAWLMGTVLALSFGWGAGRLIAGWRIPRARSAAADPAPIRAALYVLLPLTLLAGTIVLQYVSFRSAQHAMGARYLAVVWPLLALALALPLAALSRRSAAAAACVAVIVLGLWIQHGSARRLDSIHQGCMPHSMLTLSRYRALVVTSTARNQLPRLFPHLRADQSVFAIGGAAVSERENALLAGLAEHPDALVIQLGGSRAARQDRAGVSELLHTAGYELAPAEDPAVFMLRPQSLVILAGSGGTSWSPGLLDRLTRIGAPVDRIRAGAAYVAVLHGEQILAQQVREDGALEVEWGAIPLQVRAGVLPTAAGDAVFVTLNGGEVVSGGRGLAVVVYDSESGALLSRSVFAADESWRAGRRVFRIFQPFDAQARDSGG